jgi:hypothetical protein
MSDNAGAKGPEPSDRVAIGITFGNSNSSVAYTVDDKAEVIANEDGGMFQKLNFLTELRSMELLKSCSLTYLPTKTDKSLPFSPTLTATSTTVARPRPSLFATPITPSPTSETSSAKSTQHPISP